MNEFRERLERAMNARLLGAACDTEAARDFAEREWREFIEAEEARANLLRHTAECWDYAAFTCAKSGVYHCIGACSRLRRGEITPAEYLAEVRRCAT